MPPILRFDHVSITVADLEVVTDFFVGLGLEVQGRALVEGEFIAAVTGIPDACAEIVGLRAPGGGTWIELSRFIRPEDRTDLADAMPNELGIRNVCFEVDDLRATVDGLAADGYGLVGGVGRHEDVWLMAHVRGPEGIVVSLAQRIG